jgi:hypothetical protein
MATIQQNGTKDQYLNFAVPYELKRKVKIAAAMSGLSITEYCTLALEVALRAFSASQVNPFKEDSAC